VNLIGEHTDYNLGFVFPIALEMSCVVAAVPAKHGNLRIYSRDLDDEVSVPVDQVPALKPRRHWSDYVLGVAQQLIRAGISLVSQDLWITSTVPAGSGLSSSAALEVSTALALLNGRPFPSLELARLAQRAEREFVGMPCGIMDQYASVFGKEHSAIKIDCRSLQHEYATLPDNVAIVAVNSNVKHELGTSAYRDRVAECHQAVEAIQKIYPEVESLRDVPLTTFQTIQDSIPALPRKRARHVISDSQRVVDLAAAAQAADLREMGRLFVASHRSMQYDYEITCEEIDYLVDTALKLPGVYGSRMTGGGFGGCTVNLIEPDKVEAFKLAIDTAYRQKYNVTPTFYDCIPSSGAGRLL
jgi:galactokinase